MKKKNKLPGNTILIPAVLLLILFTCISVSAFEIISPGDFWLKAENQGKNNYIELEWEAGTDVFYTIYQSEDGISWQTRSSQYGKDIEVLNVYPLAGADQLKTWMETNGYGEGHISVTKVLQDDYNLTPDTYLKDSITGEYLYDVVVFGFWDANGAWDLDLTDSARDATEEYIKNGYGVLFGHDTATHATVAQAAGTHKNFIYLAEKYTNLETAHVGLDAGQIPRVGSTRIKSINNGFLLQYPHSIEYGGVFTIPLSHSYGQIANGIIWMEFTEIPTTGGNSGPVVTSAGGGTNNYYLTTWNNTAMIQTGHTSGTSNPEEQMVIANVLMYLAQYTEETTASDYSANDMEPPSAPEAVWGSNVKDLTISAEDAGTPYWYKIESTSKYDFDDLETSDIVKEYCTTGIYGYYVIEDKDDYLDFDETMATVTFYSADALEQLEYTLSDVKNYLHVKAVDYNGNVGDAALFSLYDNDMTFQITKEINEVSDRDQDFVFKLEYRTQAGGAAREIFYCIVTVPAGSLTGETEFDDILTGVYTVTELDGNWKYELKSGIQRTQTLSLTDPLDNEKEAEYWNDFQPATWIAGQDKTVNKME